MTVLYEWDERGEDRATIVARAQARKVKLDPDNLADLTVGPCRMEFQRFNQEIAGWKAACELVEREAF